MWESLQLPINLAFFLPSTPAGRVVAFYPSPAGATESLVPLEAWQTLIDDNPVLGNLHPDVEALLVNRVATTTLPTARYGEFTIHAYESTVDPNPAIAIVKGSKHRKDAEAFYDFVNTEESLILAAHQFYRIPSRTDIPTDRLPEWMRNLNIPKMQMNWDLVEAKSQEWMQHWDSYIRGASASP